MELNERKVGNIVVVDLKIGVQQRGQYEPLQQLVRGHLAAGQSRFILNLAACEWIDSSGLGELIKLLVAVMRQGGNLKLAAVPHKLKGILTVTNLTQVFEIYDSEPAALASFPA
ncbi:MAG: STAS domain-containing protein [Acidobacteria bacterium]|nr:STAS domain-containing protein [Acidobacteriota bacterium]MBI3423557.1 STAS domain-containing protein [Acidobacteriota bacterium]